MSAVYILGTGIGRVDPALQSEPRFRKATRNMLLAFTAAEKAMLGLAIDPAVLGFVLGSSHGELEMTLSFLKTQAQSGVARPLLFQNSLHNSTAGFVAMTNHISGPMLTVSNLHFSGEDALTTACSLIEDQQTQVCLVVGVDPVYPDLGPELELKEMNAPGRKEGGAAVLLGSEAAVKSLGIKPLARLTKVVCNYASVQNARPATFRESGHYDSDAIELLIRALDSEAEELFLAKADGSSSHLQWTR